MTNPKITFIGAGSTVFMKNIVGDVLQRPALADARIALMDINPQRLEESAVIAGKLISTLGTKATIETFADQRAALEGADFVVVCFQIGGYDPCTITDFEVPKKFGLRQTIADTPRHRRHHARHPHRAASVEDLRGHARGLPRGDHAAICQPDGDQHLGDRGEISDDPPGRPLPLGAGHGAVNWRATSTLIRRALRYRAAGINHMAFYLKFEQSQRTAPTRTSIPICCAAYREGRAPKAEPWNPRRHNKVRYEMLTRLGYFVTESSEHFAEYMPWFIKEGREDLIEKFGIPLDEYPKRCIEQIARWKAEAERYKTANTVEIKDSHEYASEIMNSVWTGQPSVIYGNVRNNGLITSLPEDCAVEVPCLVDASGIQPTQIGALPPQLTALMRTNINVQELTVAALIEENREHIYHAAMMDPHTAAELDLDQIWTLVDDLLASHDAWLPEWARVGKKQQVA